MLTAILTHLAAFVAGGFCALLIMAWTNDQERDRIRDERAEG